MTLFATLIMLVVKALHTAAQRNWAHVKTHPLTMRSPKTQVKPGSAMLTLCPISEGSPKIMDIVRKIGSVLKLFTCNISTVDL